MSTERTPIVSTETLKNMLAASDLVVVDCRFDLADTESGRNAFLESRIPGAVYAHLDDDLSGPPNTDNGRHPLPSPELMKQRFGDMGIDHTKYVVAYDDRKNMMAARLWWMLNYMGHRQVSVLDGGWKAWNDAGGELETTPPLNPTAVNFEGQPQASWLVTLDQVASELKIVDSRAPERYRGEVEPLDPVAGHIPGAENFYYANCLDEQGKFLPVETIREKFEQAVFHDREPEDVTFYCGSGVSACVNLIAAQQAGFPMSKLYVGSWSEWSREKGSE